MVGTKTEVLQIFVFKLRFIHSERHFGWHLVSEINISTYSQNQTKNLGKFWHVPFGMQFCVNQLIKERSGPS